LYYIYAKTGNREVSLTTGKPAVFPPAVVVFPSGLHAKQTPLINLKGVDLQRVNGVSGLKGCEEKNELNATRRVAILKKTAQQFAIDVTKLNNFYCHKSIKN